MVGWLGGVLDRFVDGSVVCLVGWLESRLVGWLVGELIGWAELLCWIGGLG